jgi:hypothetical protein
MVVSLIVISVMNMLRLPRYQRLCLSLGFLERCTSSLLSYQAFFIDTWFGHWNRCIDCVTFIEWPMMSWRTVEMETPAMAVFCCYKPVITSDIAWYFTIVARLLFRFWISLNEIPNMAAKINVCCNVSVYSQHGYISLPMQHTVTFKVGNYLYW